jgi:hypothetical protein
MNPKIKILQLPIEIKLLIQNYANKIKFNETVEIMEYSLIPLRDMDFGKLRRISSSYQRHNQNRRFATILFENDLPPYIPPMGTYHI